MKKRFFLFILLLASCKTFDEKVLHDPRFASGQEYQTNKKIKPKVFRFSDYTFVSGYNGSKSTLGMFYKDKEILFPNHSDGLYDTIIKANLNNDGIPDFLVLYAFEDREELLGLFSKSKTSFIEKKLSEDISEIYCPSGGDSLQHIQPLLVKDINNDGKDEIIVNLLKFDNKLIGFACTDTIYPDK